MKNTKTINIYSVTDRSEHNAKPMIFKGINKLRDFAIDRIYSGWETDITETDLQDDNTLLSFLNNDYGVDIEIIAQVDKNDFIKTQL